MEQISLLPTQKGQICKIKDPLADEHPEDVYIITEDLSPFEIDEDIFVANLKDVQNNQNAPVLIPQIAIEKGDLTVIADDLQAFINSWNVI